MKDRDHSLDRPARAVDGLLSADAVREITDSIVAKSEALIKTARQSIAQSAALAAALDPQLRSLTDLAHSQTSEAFKRHLANALTILEQAPLFPVPQQAEPAVQANPSRSRRSRVTPDSFA
jgi:hypothetical protein